MTKQKLPTASLGGVVYELSGSYLPIWWGAVGLSVVAMALHVPITAKPALQYVVQQRSPS